MKLNEPLAERDVLRLGIDPRAITSVDLIHARWDGRLYRISCGRQSFILKRFDGRVPWVEQRGYAILRDLGVPTLHLHAGTESALLLEDLASSDEWRLASPEDNLHHKTGKAVAEWYRALHAAGRELLSRPGPAPEFLTREEDVLNPERIVWMGDRLDMGGNPLWRLAADHIDAIKQAIRGRPETLNYNDFHWSNLALSRPGGGELRAVVFDYHLLGIGMACSDRRNVAGSLEGDARSAFEHAYGPVDEQEAVLDAAVSELYSLSVALDRPELPAWAKGAVDMAGNGELTKRFQRAIDLIG